MKLSELRQLIKEEIKNTLNEDININESRLRELLIEAFMTGAYQSIKVLGEYDEPKLQKFAEEFADFYINKMR